MRKAFLAVVVLGCLVVPVRAAATGPATTLTATGTVLTVQTQYVSVSNGDGTTTECEVLGGDLRTATGEDIPFAVGGVLTPAAGTPHGTLDPAVQAMLDTLQTGSDEGANAIVTIVYETTHPLCGYNLLNFVTSASLRPAPTPTPFPTATPAPTPTPTPQTTATVTGTVVRMSPLGVFVLLGTEACHVWPGRLRTATGRTIDFAVETPLAGDVRHGGANPTDPAALPRATRLTQAYLLRKRATATITYTGPVVACGEPLPAVVTAASVTVTKPHTYRRTGRIARIGAPRIASADGDSCRVWTGRLKVRFGSTLRFAVETPLAGTKPVDPHAAKLAATLRRANARQRRVKVTFVGPVIACGETFDLVVRRVAS